MSRSDDLRHTLHDPDYWLGPPEPLAYSFLATIGEAIGSAVLTLVGIGGTPNALVFTCGVRSALSGATPC